MNRRGFLGLAGGLAAGMVLDPERLLWVPGKKVISIPKLDEAPKVIRLPLAAYILKWTTTTNRGTVDPPWSVCVDTGMPLLTPGSLDLGNGCRVSWEPVSAKERDAYLQKHGMIFTLPLLPTSSRE